MSQEKRWKFFRHHLSKYREECRKSKSVFTDRKFINYLKGILSEETWNKIKSRIDPREARLPHHLRPGYNVKTAKSARGRWQTERHDFMYGPLVCETCGSREGPIFNKSRTANSHTLKGLALYCSDSCSKKSNHARQARQKTCLERYGVANVSHSQLYQDKIKAYVSSLDQEYWRQRARVSRRTKIQKHGSLEAARNKASSKRIQTNQARYGGNAPTCDPKVRAKVRRTNQRRRGVDNPSHDPEVLHKIRTAQRKSKSIKINGVVFDGLQGYEPQVITWLCTEKGIKPSQIRQPVKSIAYELQGKSRKYLPDLVIERKGHPQVVLEVKSDYTACLVKDIPESHGWGTYEELRAKVNACAHKGVKICLVIPLFKSSQFIGCFVWKGELPRNRRVVYREYSKQKLQAQQARSQVLCEPPG